MLTRKRSYTGCTFTAIIIFLTFTLNSNQKFTMPTRINEGGWKKGRNSGGRDNTDHISSQPRPHNQ